MLEPLLLPSGALLKLGAAEILPEQVTVDDHTTASRVTCPDCQSETQPASSSGGDAHPNPRRQHHQRPNAASQHGKRLGC
jgi:hypothetical protein